jgi:hypothetical protein
VSRFRAVAAIGAVILVSSCQAAVAPPLPGPGPYPVTGAWGGVHVSLVLQESGGMLEYDCASGEIDGPLRTDSAGRFSAVGYHTPGQGGPEREGYVPPRQPATYSGRVQGDVMTLLVSIPSTGVQIGPLTLRRGAEPTIFRCL